MTALSVVIAARDEEDMLPGCLARLGFADQVVVALDDRTTDTSADISARFGATVVPVAFSGFASVKNAGMAAATGDWVLIVDADERVTDALAREVEAACRATGPEAAYRVPIENYFYGRRMRHGGWATELPMRLFRRSGATYTGDVHEVLTIPPGATVGTLSSPLVHFSHRSIIDSLRKSSSYVDLEARAMLAQGAPKVTAWRAARAAGRELAWRGVRRSGWRDGVPGVIETIYQPLVALAVHVRLWELQQSPSVPEKYADLERRLT